MKIRLEDGVSLYFDTQGSALDVENGLLKEKPTIILLHGGPGLDHTVFKPAFDSLADLVQIVYLDQRGCGRSDDGEKEKWNLEQWADDVASFINYLDIRLPIILGTSFGGFVAQKFAVRHPDLLSGLVLMSTAARTDIDASLQSIAKLGGDTAQEAAADFFSDAAKPGVVERYFENCLHLYTHNQLDEAAMDRITQRPEVMMHFFSKGGEMYHVDMIDDLLSIKVPTLVVHGEDDPIFPLSLAEQMFSLLDKSTSKTQLVSIPKCGHLSEQDAPDQITQAIKRFFSL